jgi:hypothetical protein
MELPIDPSEYEVIAQKRDIDGPVIDRALEIVREFIISRKLILYGGLAIDYALRLKGANIYPDDERPDFDFFSPNNIEDAYDLADILYKQGFKDISAIRALHVQTMRVRVSFITVADISHTPQEVFDQMPTINFRSMRVLHPNYQRIDMHLAFCFPFNNPPREDVFNRFYKDIKRFNLFEKFYPIIPNKSEEQFTQRTIIINPSLCAIHGFAAYALLRNSLNELAEVVKIDIPQELPNPKFEIYQIPKSNLLKITVELPTQNSDFILASPWPEEALQATSTNGDNRRFDPYMDSRPYMLQRDDPNGIICIYSTRLRLLAISRMKNNLNIVSAQYLLLYFLHNAQTGNDRELFLKYYKFTLKMLSAADVALSKHCKHVPKDIFRKVINSTPFMLTTRTLGKLNYNEAYRIRLSSDIQQSHLKLPQNSPLLYNLPNLVDLPENYYPGSARYQTQPRPSFDYNSNSMFRRSGKEIV